MKVPQETETIFRALVGDRVTVVRLHTRCPLQANFMATGVNELFAIGKVAVSLIVCTSQEPEYEIVASAEKGFQHPKFYTLHKYDPEFAHQ